MGNWIKLLMRVLWRVLASAWMPFAVCIATLLWTVVRDILSSMYPVAMTAVRSDFLVTVAVAGCFLGAHAIGLLFAFTFLFRRNRQCLIRLLLVVLSLVVYFGVGQKWADYSWKNMRPAIELRIAGKRLARERDRDIEAPGELSSLIHSLNRHVYLRKVVFSVGTDIDCGDFAEHFLCPCSRWGIDEFAFRLPDGVYSFRGFAVGPCGDGHRSGVDAMYRCWMVGKVAAVKAASDGKLRFESNYRTREVMFRDGEIQSAGDFADSEDAVLGDGAASGYLGVVVLAEPGCPLSIVQDTIRRLSQSRYRTIVLLITAVPEEPQEHEERAVPRD